MRNRFGTTIHLESYIKNKRRCPDYDKKRGDTGQQSEQMKLK